MFPETGVVPVRVQYGRRRDPEISQSEAEIASLERWVHLRPRPNC